MSENGDGGAEEPFEIDYDRYLVMMNLIGQSTYESDSFVEFLRKYSIKLLK